MDRILRVREVAERLGLSERTVRTWVSQRRLPVVRLGRAVGVSEAALARWIAERSEEARTMEPRRTMRRVKVR